ncbi:hypothetical protein E2C01_090452 [Portunus trituberculatus]|uniref:Uncharacterized protein n=1 Tax=Portunus trituberculatus TaxID=210409 RepID=A0A5B7JER3_PORTR|nr:hypothetical protein [Portunus trituberculatus]
MVSYRVGFEIGGTPKSIPFSPEIPVKSPHGIKEKKKDSAVHSPSTPHTTAQLHNKQTVTRLPVSRAECQASTVSLFVQSATQQPHTSQGFGSSGWSSLQWPADTCVLRASSVACPSVPSLSGAYGVVVTR